MQAHVSSRMGDPEWHTEMEIYLDWQNSFGEAPFATGGQVAFEAAQRLDHERAFFNREGMAFLQVSLNFARNRSIIVFSLY